MDEGVRFTNGYVAHGVSGPSRAAIMTGRAPARFGVYSNTDAQDGIPLTETFLPELFQNHGYYTAAVGKWHLSKISNVPVPEDKQTRDYHDNFTTFSAEEWQPQNRGFDYFMGFHAAGTAYYNSPSLFKNRERVPAKGYISDQLTDEAIGVVDRAKTLDQPFMLYLAYNAPHLPNDNPAPEQYQKQFNTGSQTADNYYASVYSVDQGVKRILEQLKKNGQYDNTIILFTSDNGAVIDGPLPLNGAQKGYKSQTYPGGTHTPMFMWWKGKLQPGNYDKLKPFWLRKNNKTSVLLIIIILAMILGVVKIQVWLNDWNNDFFNALSQKETDKLWQLVLWFPALLGIFVLISVNKTWLIKLLTIRWREWLTDYYLNRWFADKNYYFTQIYGEHKNTDNPDQRIAEDILLLISKTLSLSFGFIQSLSMLITFTVILWQSAGTLSFTVGGTEWSIQGYMVYTVVLIVIGGTLFTHKVGKRIRPLNVEKQRSEATFRTNLVQHNKQAELIALSNAESLQRQELSENFHTIKENWHRLMNRQRWLDYWQNIYSRSLSVLPYFLLLPQFISGQINLGGLMKSRQAFMLVSNNLSWFIYKYDELAELAAVIDRLYEFHQLTEQRPTNKPKNCQHAVQVADASIRTPDNKIILENLNFHVSPGKWLLLKGYSGAGKTTLLKTLSHCWPWFKGDISSPADSWYVSQTPLIKTGLLKEIICKALPLSVDDKSLSEVLHQVGLGKLAARIHDHDRWGDILSSGEKQRIALARLILRRPKWIFLDETTSHLEEQEAIRLLRLVREKLPTSGVIMVTHQPGVWNLVDDICDISAVI